MNLSRQEVLRLYAGVDGNMASVAAPLISSVVDAVSRIPKCCGEDQVFNSSAGYGGKLKLSLHLMLLLIRDKSDTIVLLLHM